jgi:hypothetical protein
MRIAVTALTGFFTDGGVHAALQFRHAFGMADVAFHPRWIRRVRVGAKIRMAVRATQAAVRAGFESSSLLVMAG